MAKGLPRSMTAKVVKDRWDKAPTTRLHSVADYNDLGTTASPISLSAGVKTKLTNDAAGEFTTTEFIDPSITRLWDEENNQCDYTDLKLGDIICKRIDILITTTTPNTDVILGLDSAIGGFAYSLDFARYSFKLAGTYELLETIPLYMRDANTRDHPSELMIESDATASVVVNGWAFFVN